MSLTTKIAAILTALILLLTVAGAVIQNSVFGGLFERIERDEAGLELQRVRAAMEAEIEQVATSARRIGAHPPTMAFLADRGAASTFAADNVTPVSLRAERLDLLYVCDTGGNVAAGLILDPLTHEPTSLRDFPSDRLTLAHPLLAWAGTSAEKTLFEPKGILTTSRDPILVAVEPVVGHGRRTVGYVITGRFLAGDTAARISERTQVDFDAWAIDGRSSGLPADVLAIQSEVTGSGVPVVREADDGKSLAVYATFDDIRRRPMLLLRAKVERRISAAASATLASGGITDATIGLATLLGLLFILNMVVLRPIKALTHHAVQTGQSENFRAKFGLEREDEIGTLGTAFDEMMAKLEQARAALVETARTAGMSEIATGILHNVGNVLNSVNISASLVSQRVEGLCLDDLERLAQVLAEHKDDLPRFLTEDPRGQHIEPFLSALVVQLGEEQRAIRGEVDSLTDGIDHICELIKSQQNLAKGTSLIEPTDLALRMDEALRITQRVHGIDNELVVVRRYEDLGEVDLDKHKLLEILVNLVQNARQAMNKTSGPRELALEVRESGDGIMLSVADTGVGINADDIERVFQMGFTTRDEGHGFGLHSSANAAKEMGGRLYATSDGPGRGARFVLELPRVPPGFQAGSDADGTAEGAIAVADEQAGGAA